jgi:Immunity protein 63
MIVDEIITEINRLAATADLPLVNQNNETKIEKLDNGSFSLIDFERGNTVSTTSFSDYSELIFQYFYDVTSNVAHKFELENRIEGQDPRRLKNEKHLELMSAINPEWHLKTAQKIQLILDKNPYDDDIYADIFSISDNPYQNGVVYKNSLHLMKQFTQQFGITDWGKIVTKAIKQWNSDKSTEFFYNAFSKKNFLIGKTEFSADADKGLLSIYVEWLKLISWSFCHHGISEFPQYAARKISGAYCEHCTTSQTTPRNIGRYIGLGLLQKIFPENLPFEDKLSNCYFHSIADNSEFRSQKEFLYKILRFHPVEVSNLDVKQMKRCVFCKKPTTKCSWAAIGSNYLDSTLEIEIYY